MGVLLGSVRRWCWSSKASAELSVHALPVALAVLGVAAGLLIAQLPTVVLLGAFGVLGVMLGSLAEPLVGLGAALVAGPLRAWLEIRSPGLAPHVGQALLLWTLAAWIARGLWQRDLRLWLPGLVVPLACFVFVGMLSLWGAVDLEAGVTELLKWIQILIVCAVVWDRLVRVGERAALLAAGGAVTGAIFQAAIGVWQFMGEGTVVDEFAIRKGLYRAYGTFQQPNPYAGFVGFMGAFAAGVALGLTIDAVRRRHSGDGWWGLAGLWATAALLVAGLVASWSRGGWMGFGAAVIVLIALLPHRRLTGIGLMALVVGLGVLLLVTGRLPAALMERLAGGMAYLRFTDVRGVGITDENFAVIERMAHWQAALNMWRDRFWLGVGLGGYEAAYPAHRLMAWTLPLGHAHNFYLNLLAEVGVVGTLVFLGWGLILAWGLLWTSNHTRGALRALTLGLIGAWVHLTIHSLVDHLVVNNVHLHLGVLLALSAWVFDEAHRQWGERRDTYLLLRSGRFS